MTNKWIAINVVLLGLVALLSWQLRLAIGRFNSENNLAKIQGSSAVKAGDPVAAAQAVKRYNPAEFAVIPAQNLFSDTRSKEEKVEAPPVPEAPILAVKPVLVGVTMSGNERMAIINDPAIQGRRKTQTKRLGDSYQGYTITDITATQMVLENGSRREVIPLFDGAKHQPQAGKTPILATRIVSFGGGGSSGGGQMAVPGAVATAVPVGRPAVPAPVAAGGGSSGSLVNTVITPAQAQQMNTQTPAPPRSATAAPVRQPAPATNIQQPGPNIQQPGATWNERTNEQGRRVIRTPFGDIIRDQPPNP